MKTSLLERAGLEPALACCSVKAALANEYGGFAGWRR